MRLVSSTIVIPLLLALLSSLATRHVAAADGRFDNSISVLPAFNTTDATIALGGDAKASGGTNHSRWLFTSTLKGAAGPRVTVAYTTAAAAEGTPATTTFLADGSVSIGAQLTAPFASVGTLTVLGDTELQGTMDVAGPLRVANDMRANSVTTGAVTADTVTAMAGVVTSSLTVSQQLDAAMLRVSGNVDTAALSAETVGVSGAVTAGELNIAGGATVQGGVTASELCLKGDGCWSTFPARVTASRYTIQGSGCVGAHTLCSIARTEPDVGITAPTLTIQGGGNVCGFCASDIQWQCVISCIDVQ